MKKPEEDLKQIRARRFKKTKHDELKKKYVDFSVVSKNMADIFSSETLPRYKTVEELTAALNSNFIEILGSFNENSKKPREIYEERFNEIYNHLNEVLKAINLSETKIDNIATKIERHIEIAAEIIKDVANKINNFPYGSTDVVRFNYYNELLEIAKASRLAINQIESDILSAIELIHPDYIAKEDDVNIEHGAEYIESDAEQPEKEKGKEKETNSNQDNIVVAASAAQTKIKRRQQSNSWFSTVFQLASGSKGQPKSLTRDSRPFPSFFNEMPVELSLRIASFLTPEELLNFGLVDATLHSLTNDNMLWEYEFKKYFPAEYNEEKNNYLHAKSPHHFWRQRFSNKYPLRDLLSMTVVDSMSGLLRHLISKRKIDPIVKELFHHMMVGNVQKVADLLANDDLIKKLCEPLSLDEHYYNYDRQIRMTKPLLYFFLIFCQHQNMLDLFYNNRELFKTPNFLWRDNVFQEWMWSVLCKQQINDFNSFMNSYGRARQDNDGLTILDYAVAANYRDLIPQLATINRNYDGAYALIIAVRHDHVSMVRLLFEEFPNYKKIVKDTTNYSSILIVDKIIEIALENNSENMLKVFFELMTVTQIVNLLDKAVSEGKVDFVKTILSCVNEDIRPHILNTTIHPGSPTPRSQDEGRRFSEYLPLKISCDKKNLAMLECLLLFGADPNVFFKQEGFKFPGCTAIWLAIKNGDEKMVQLLLAAGANPNIKLHLSNPDRATTPLQFARVQYKDKAMVAIIKALEDKSNVDQNKPSPRSRKK